LLIFIYLFLKLHLKKFSYSRVFWDAELFISLLRCTVLYFIEFIHNCYSIYKFIHIVKNTFKNISSFICNIYAHIMDDVFLSRYQYLALTCPQRRSTFFLVVSHVYLAGRNWPNRRKGWKYGEKRIANSSTWKFWWSCRRYSCRTHCLRTKKLLWSALRFSHPSWKSHVSLILHALIKHEIGSEKTEHLSIFAN